MRSVDSNRTLQPVIIMLFMALIMQLIPISGEWLLWRPNFLLLVMIVWALYFPEQYSIGFSMMLGLFADLTFSTTLGSHVFIFAVCGAVANLLHRVVAYLALGHRVMIVALLVLIAELLGAVFGEYIFFWEHIFYVVVMSSLFWIPMDKLVGKFYRFQK